MGTSVGSGCEGVCIRSAFKSKADLPPASGSIAGNYIFFSSKARRLQGACNAHAAFENKEGFSVSDIRNSTVT